MLNLEVPSVQLSSIDKLRSVDYMKNNTTRFHSMLTRSSIRIPRKDSPLYRMQLKGDYEQRLQYETEWCNTCNGKTIMITLTYSNRYLPKFLGRNVHDNRHIYNFFVAFRKYLNYTYGYDLKYFCAPEFGEGGKTHNYVGQRGKGCNPHYHAIIWIYNKIQFSPVHISIPRLRFLVDRFWNHEHISKTRDSNNKVVYTLANDRRLTRGRTSVDGDFITDYKATSYTSKYTIKDVLKSQVVSSIRSIIFSRSFASIRQLSSRIDLFRHYICRIANYMSYQHFDVVFADYFSNECIKVVSISHFLSCLRAKHFDLITENPDLTKDKKLRICDTDKVLADFHKYLRDYVIERADYCYKEFCKRHAPKVHISQGVGLYALNFVDSCAKIQVNNGKTLKQTMLGPYLFKKYFYDKPSEHKNENGSPCYVPNSRYFDFRVKFLSRDIDEYVRRATDVFSTFQNNSRLYERVFSRNSLLPKPVDFACFVSEYCNCDDFRKLAEYNLIYKFRRFQSFDSLPIINPSGDFKTFLAYDIANTFSSSELVAQGVDYSQHPYFNSILYFDEVYNILRQSLSLLKSYDIENKSESNNRVRQSFNNLSHVQ